MYQEGVFVVSNSWVELCVLFLKGVVDEIVGVVDEIVAQQEIHTTRQASRQELLEDDDMWSGCSCWFLWIYRYFLSADSTARIGQNRATKKTPK